MANKNYHYPEFLQSQVQYNPYYNSYYYPYSNLCYNYSPEQFKHQNHYHPNFKSFIEDMKKREEALKHESVIKIEAETKVNKVTEDEVEEKVIEIKNSLMRGSEKLSKNNLKIKYFDINVAPTITSDYYAMVEEKEKEMIRKGFMKKHKHMKINEIDFPEEDSNPFIIFKNRRIKKKFKKYLKDEEEACDKSFVESSVESVELEVVKVEERNVHKSDVRPLKIEAKNEEFLVDMEGVRY